jgi:hypothetical protein
VLQPDGTLEVTETLTIRPSAAISSVARRLDPPRADAVTFVAAAVEAAGGFAAPKPVTVTAGPPLDIHWALDPAMRVAQRVSVTYRATGVLEVAGTQRRLTWQVLPRRTHDLDHVEVALTLPAGATLLTPSGLAEAGWTVAATRSSLTASRVNVPAGESSTVVALMAIEGPPAAEPAWQFRAARVRDLAPAFASGGLFILVIAAGILWILGWQWRTGTPDAAATAFRQLRLSGLIVIVFGIVTAIATHLLLGQYGLWPQALPLGFVLGGALFVAVGVYRSRVFARSNAV